MKSIFQFGQEVQGYNVKVLNERQIRASAGLLFLFLFISVMLALLKADFFMIKVSITLFFIDIFIRTVINPEYAPTMIIGKLIVAHQTPEYVGAEQKRFAWILGILLSGIAFVLMVLLNTYSPVTGLICMFCLLFLFFEAAFGICLGCLLYGAIIQRKTEYCPGNTCEDNLSKKENKTSTLQKIILISYIVLIILITSFFADDFRKNPVDLFGNRFNAGEFYNG